MHFTIVYIYIIGIDNFFRVGGGGGGALKDLRRAKHPSAF